MYIFINSTDAEVWRNATRLRKALERLENATLDPLSPSEANWNFSNRQDIAAFLNLPLGKLMASSVLIIHE